MTIRLTNTKTRRKEDFVPINPTDVRMYVCGPTVYDRAHLGNARPVVVFDVLYRLLRHVYGADHVTYVRNFTDVDDKINAEAQRRQAAGAAGTLEDLIRERTEETIAWYHADMDALGALRPNMEPRATEFVGQMIAMIAGLIDKGHAYAVDGHVLFAVDSYAAYGRLSGRTVDDMIAGARVEVAPYKKNPMDFVLWKPSDATLPGWDSPWGRGRPGWHIECSAMAQELLGESFDIHGGGLDLQFPHHENEIAQSACAHPHGEFARVWMHNEMLLVEGKKMSKSLGNFFTVRDLLDKGVPGEVIRFVLLSTHYRSPMDWRRKTVADCETVLRKWRALTAGIKTGASPIPEFVEMLCDDLNVAGGIAILHAAASTGDFGGLKASAQLIGLLEDGFGDWAVGGHDPRVAKVVSEVLEIRALARSTRNWGIADGIRDALKRAGIKVSDTKEITAWSIEKDELDSYPIFESVRNALMSGSEVELERQLKLAEEAGIYFADVKALDVSSAWRGLPANVHILRELGPILSLRAKLV